MDSYSLFKNKSVLILGLAKTGLSVFFAIKDLGCQIKCLDDNKDVLESFCQEHGYIYRLDDKFNLDELGQFFDYVIPSPGFTISHKICKKAYEIGILISDLDVLYLKNPDAFYIGLTGTDGKSSTCTLISEVLKANNVNYALGGNVGTPALTLPAAKVYVLEISSFQLDLTQHLRLNLAVLLNVHEDHLDYYKTLEIYAKAKEKIFNLLKANVTSILCVEDNICLNLLNKLSNTTNLQNLIGIFKPFNGFESLQNIQHTYESAKNINIFYIKNKSLFNYNNQEIADFSNLNFVGNNNDLYSSVAYFCAKELNLSEEITLNAIKKFSGLKHRIQKVLISKNVTFVNDSKATNIVACAYALKNFKNIFWLAGGICQDEQNLEKLMPYANNIKKAYFFGKSANNLASVLGKYMDYNIFDTLNESFLSLTNDTKKYAQNCVALLSPACKSFDQFENFEHRGQTFIDLCLKYQKN